MESFQPRQARTRSPRLRRKPGKKTKENRAKAIAQIAEYERTGTSPASLIEFSEAAGIPASTFSSSEVLTDLSDKVREMTGLSAARQEPRKIRLANAIAQVEQDPSLAKSLADVARVANVPYSVMFDAGFRSLKVRAQRALSVHEHNYQRLPSAKEESAAQKKFKTQQALNRQIYAA